MHTIRELLNGLGLPGGAITGELYIAVAGNREISIAGVQAVKEYSLERLRVQVEGGFFQIEGNALEIVQIGGGIARVSGKIKLMEFQMDKERE